jgi:GGDEF domain-containing protein
MLENSCLTLVQTVLDSHDEMSVVFENENHVVTNKAFNKFFGVKSIQEYNANFGPILDNFVPHPSYFHKEKLEQGENWFDAISRLDEIDRIVSILTQEHEPKAFSVKINITADGFRVVTLKDITRDLIKRIMTENHVNIDKRSGAYDKKYFLQIAQNFEDAAVFNEKILGAFLLSIDTQKNPQFANDRTMLQDFVSDIKKSIRQDDMLVRWNPEQFLLVYLVDNEQHATQMQQKMQHLLESNPLNTLSCSLRAAVQKEREGIKSIIKRIEH